MYILIIFLPFIIGCTSLIIQKLCVAGREQRAEKRRLDKIVAEAEARRQREREREQRRIAAEEERWRREWRQKERQQQIAAEAKKLRDAEMSDHKRMVAEQRRLMTDSLRYDILVRDGFRCKICGASAADGITLHVDHILPVSKGGKTDASNLRTLCERCNLGKRDKIESVPIPSARVDFSVPSDPVLPAMPDAFDTVDALIAALSEREIRFIDKRPVGGCLWIESSPQSDPFLSTLTVGGQKLSLARITHHFHNSPGWYIR